MGVHDLCRKCSLLLTRGHLILLNPPNDGPRRMLMTRVCLFLDNDDDPEEGENVFRSLRSSEEIVRHMFDDPSHDEVDTSVLRHSFFLHYHLDALTESAENGCHLCAKFCKGFNDNEPYSDFPGQGKKIRCIPRFTYHDLYRPGSEESIPIRSQYMMMAGISRENIDALLLQEDAPDHSGYLLNGLPLLDGAVLPSQPPTPVGQLIGGIKSDTLARLESWLEECQHHDCCGQNTIPGRPARLIHITKAGVELKLRLVDTRDIHVDSLLKYATLSHCWGKSPIETRLLRRNLDAYMSEIPHKSLPRTFREAIGVAVALKVSYLWIDALCIVQDLSSDWDSEAPRMRSIYTGGVFNIAAVGSKDSEGGLLCQDNRETQCETTITWTGAYPRSGRARIGFMSAYSHRIVDSVLACRAWVFQERFLSRCVIYFAEDQLWWECRDERHSEFGGLDPTFSQVEDGEPESIHSLFEAGQWLPLVEQYARCELTKKSDRLIAISGIAELFAAKHGLEPHNYANGLWLKSLPQSLLWRCNYFSNEFDETDKAWISSERAAPTWSWASVRPGVTWNNDFNDRSAVDISDEMSWLEDFAILDKPSCPSLENPFRGTRDAQMIMKAMLHPVIFKNANESNQHLFESMELAGLQYEWGRHCWDSTHETMETCVFELHPDIDTSAIGRLPSYFMPMMRRIFEGPGVQYREQQSFEGLVISPVLGKKGTYIRLGVLEVKFSEEDAPIWWSIGSHLDKDLYIAEFGDMLYKIALE